MASNIDWMPRDRKSLTGSSCLQVRVIVERLARRCGYDAVAAAIPEAHRKLLTHIRKERVRKDGRRHSEAGSEV